MKYLLALCLLYHVSFAQKKCFSIVDSVTNLPVPYAAITCKGCLTGTYSDQNGTVCVDFAGIDTIRIYSLSYKILFISASEINAAGQVKLLPNPIELNPVTVSKRKIHSIRLGPYYTNKLSIGQHVVNPNSATLLAVYIPNTVGDAVISKLYYRLSPKKSEIATLFRCRIHLWDNVSMKPGNSILKHDEYIDIEPSQKKAEIDVTQYALKIPENGIWIGIEVVAYKDLKGGFVTINGGDFGDTVWGKRKTKILTISPGYAVVPANDGHNSLTKFWNLPWRPLQTVSEKAKTFAFGLDVLQ
ncbi:hypothetical protein [Arsenicibacter rosenii]|uniref:Carboxypeptidase-like regulatory domain-containing protein n=1 Tax=Arsenicibacter rosenii TaxID=1750698 RepID=A0A1S2VDQ8_9BACT|nr:hypothetical protein [Arsenicibacter rosenii]OIN56540.1 hypothetical protein BLX24_24025 [Arsenicibacter rosenii]